MKRTSRISHETILHSFDVEPDARWWDALESNFYQRPEGFDLSVAEELMVRPTAALDRVVRTVGSASLALTIFPFGYHSRETATSISLSPNRGIPSNSLLTRRATFL